jgi:hypothetical protein
MVAVFGPQEKIGVAEIIWELSIQKRIINSRDGKSSLNTNNAGRDDQCLQKPGGNSVLHGPLIILRSVHNPIFMLSTSRTKDKYAHVWLNLR